MKGSLLTTLFAITYLALNGQVSVDRPIHFSGDQSWSGVSGLAAPDQASSLMSVGTAILDKVRLADASYVSDTIYLSVAPSGALTNDGTILRFVSPGSPSGKWWVAVNGSAPKVLVRTDGEPIPRGLIVQGSICEVIPAGDSFFLISPALRGCPVGTVAITERTCIATSKVIGLNFYGAVDHCASRGGSLCTWGEFVAACFLVGNQLNDLFTEWEWIDDTSNHTHTAAQVGRTSCMSQRAGGALVTVDSSTRCCFRIR